MKKRTNRMTAMTKSWATLVCSQANIELSKENRKKVEKLWYQGYSHKDAALELKAVQNG